MGNKIGRRRQVVDEKYTRPQGLYQHRDIDQKKLRKLILDSKLAPCYPGEEDLAIDLEECPICFLYYPSLNRSRCCMKGICTECFLQMKPHNTTRPTQCPFCKTSSYAVEYRGMRTKEEKGMEQLEEQKVIEAQIRMRQQELQDEEERMLKRQEASSSSRIVTPVEAEFQGVSNNTLSVPSFRYSTHGDEFVSPQTSCGVPASRRPSHSRQNREDNFDLDLEEIMVMEAIWLSIQEQGSTRNPACGGSSLLGPSSSEDCYDSHAITPVETSSGGLACAVAALAEHQHMNGDPVNVASTSAPVFNMLQQSGCIPAGEGRMVRNYPPESWIEISPDSGRAVPREEGEWTTPDNGRSVPREEGEWTTPENGITVSREEGEWAQDYGSEMVEAGNSYTNSEVPMDAGAAALPLPEGSSMAAGHILPESFEEQMMLAMAVSLAEARARTSTPGLTWL